ncbi:MAG: M28 family peptidase [Prevotellaceae bacterium]|nr:M28 family peptidase [Prevotellaceae bacterium]
MKKYIPFLIGLALLALSSCHRRTGSAADRPDTIALQPCPSFLADTAMAYINAQCAFGPRVPGSEAWRECQQWIAEAFASLGCEVERQQTEVTVYDGTTVPCVNIIARLNPQSSDRIILCSHWDSRPWADNDPDEANHHTPVLAANDGASGVAVMLEILRAIRQAEGDTLRTGIDFICFDVEDYGTPQWADDVDEETGDTWCLGATYWAREAANNNYRARFGILFDMVGGRGSTFSMERVSREYAEPVVQMLWHIAQQIGYGHYFPLRDGGFITDDHVAVNRIAHVPCIDIVPYHEDGPSSFGPTWHTLSDTPENIDPGVLEAVGQSVLQLLYNDSAE